MIFYFSGTGNSRWIARGLARRLGDRAVDIAGPEAAAAAADLSGEERMGLVFPIYAWGVSEPMRSFARGLRVPEGAFSFGVCTYGSEAGRAMRALAREVRLDSAYGIAMPNNYVTGSDLERPGEVRAKLAAARAEVARIAREVAAREPVARVDEGSAALLKSTLVNWGFNRFARSTSPFAATEGCTGCGRCAAECPAGAIEMSGGAPRWRADSCYLCQRCINACPQAAIQYGGGTASRTRYTIDRYLDGGPEA